MKKPRSTNDKIKKPRRMRRVPTIEIVAELLRRPEPSKEFDLRERGKRGSRIVEFTQMEGREVR
jgi:hypothetical protein